METQASQSEKPSGPNRNILIIAGVIIILCCCCLVLAGVGFYGYKYYQENNPPSQSGPEAFTPIPPIINSGPTSAVNSASADEPPIGGLGNDILKNDTWRAVSAAAVGLGCDQPIGSQSTIDVLKQPDNAGVWDEKWTVACQSGKSYAFKVEFILDSTGATYNITPIK